MTDTSTLTGDIEAAVEEDLGIPVTVEEDSGRLIISGGVESEEMAQAVLDIATRFSGDMPIDSDIEVIQVLAGETGDLEISVAEVGDLPGADDNYEEDEEIEPGNFTDQETFIDPAAASGAGRSTIGPNDDPSEGDRVYIPPVDPVGTDTEVIGGFSESSLSSLRVERSSDGTYGDEAIEEAVRRELREDAGTNPLDLQVTVHDGIVTLRGRVQTLNDGENAVDVASRVPGVRDVVDATEPESGYLR